MWPIPQINTSRPRRKPTQVQCEHSDEVILDSRTIHKRDFFRILKLNKFILFELVLEKAQLFHWKMFQFQEILHIISKFCGVLSTPKKKYKSTVTMKIIAKIKILSYSAYYKKKTEFHYYKKLQITYLMTEQ